MAAILAVVFLVFLVVLGVRSDEKVEEFLNSAGVIEKFAKARGAKAKGSSQTPPLVKQAQSFGLYLNPPALPKSKLKAPASTRGPAVRPSLVSARFQLIGTSFHHSHPELSMALIDEPGKGMSWVRQSSRVGHLLIDRIKDGFIVVKDGKRTFELAPKRVERRSLVKGKAGKAADAGTASPSGGASRITTVKKPPQLTDERTEMLGKLISQMMAAQVGSEPAKTGSQPGGGDKMEMMKELLSQFQDTRIGSEEAEKLDRLGRQLKNVRQEPNQLDPPGRRGPPPGRRSRRPLSPRTTKPRQ